MSKAILVLEEMPENCLECKCQFIHVSLNGEIFSFCGAPSKKQRECVNDYQTCRPEWCPLRPTPKKKQEKAYQNEMGCEVIVHDYNKGWNDCLKAIERSGEDG